MRSQESEAFVAGDMPSTVAQRRRQQKHLTQHRNVPEHHVAVRRAQLAERRQQPDEFLDVNRFGDIAVGRVEFGQEGKGVPQRDVEQSQLAEKPDASLVVWGTENQKQLEADIPWLGLLQQ